MSRGPNNIKTWPKEKKKKIKRYSSGKHHPTYRNIAKNERVYQRDSTQHSQKINKWKTK